MKSTTKLLLLTMVILLAFLLLKPDAETWSERRSRRSRRRSRRRRNNDDDSGGGWSSATATWYTSYPPCCNPGFTGDKSECDDYSGCKYQGMFAAFDDKKSESWVRENNIVAFYQSPNSRNRKEWAAKWKNRRLRIRNPKTGKTMEVTVVDTCDDGDCSGCCSKNANKNGGTLVDLEYNTALRFYDGEIEDFNKIEWQLA